MFHKEALRQCNEFSVSGTAGRPMCAFSLDDPPCEIPDQTYSLLFPPQRISRKVVPQCSEFWFCDKTGMLYEREFARQTQIDGVEASRKAKTME